MRHRLWRVGLLAGGIVVLAILSAQRVSVWGDERALWAEAAQRAPMKPRPWINLGRQYALRGYPQWAAMAYREGIRVASDARRSPDERLLGRVIGEANLALLKLEAGDRDGARADLAALAEAHPSVGSVVAVRTWADRTF